VAAFLIVAIINDFNLDYGNAAAAGLRCRRPRVYVREACMRGLKVVLQMIAMASVMFCNIDLATTGRPVEAIVITVAMIIIGL
jgi:hypothetical protein